MQAWQDVDLVLDSWMGSNKKEDRGGEDVQLHVKM